MDKVLIVIPIKPNMSKGIYDKMMSKVTALLRNTKTNTSLFIDTRIAPDIEKKTSWSKVAVIRNQILDDGLWHLFSHLLWIDADVVEMSDDMLDRLLETNPEGITAPWIKIEGNNTFYDWAAFIIKGTDHIQPENRWHIPNRNINPQPPYFKEFTSISEWDCVGTVTLVNTDIYKAGARYEDHPAFTDHYPICKKCRDMGRKVIMNKDIIVAHADLPKYGEAWH